ncbi:YhgE/Pip domain-containing protein [Microbacterium aquimaris]|uniref:YhgE/Pip domain-containing protein n=1 Tax=Microbacterium aquimaris TaxID=459816 RepID=A0ABU5N2Y0_9MICO|nr:YhgE/Pip domain-containing protein [Microbacterium aquimaris]MDZ8160420.1 YhgE/Pip domain-containing protein [Microbacterium aquimaris]
MRNIWRVFTRDLKRLVRVPLAMVIVGGALITPSLYAWFNISAFWDPFDNTANLPIAVVNLDEGASTTLTGEVNVGDQLVAQLKDNHDLGWQFLSESEAMESIDGGEVYAAFVVPETFSADLLSLTTGDFTQPKLEYYVNEKENGIAPEITDTGATTVQTQMIDAFTEQVAEAVATAIETGGSDIEAELIETESKIIADLEEVEGVIGETRGHLESLEADLSVAATGLRSNVGTLSAIDGALANVQGTLADARALADTAQADLVRVAGEATTGHVIASAEVAEAAAAALAGVAEVSAATDSLAAAVEAQRVILDEAEGLVTGLADQLDATAAALANLDGDLADLQSDMGVAISDLQALGGAALWQQLESLTQLDPKQIGEFMATPVVVDQVTLFPTNSYGSQMGSLFINLSLWIGAFVLVVILKLGVDDDEIPDLTERQGYLGRWLLFAAIATAQAITLSIGNLIIGVQHVNVAAFVITPVLIGLSYLSIIYALSVTFGYVGKGLVVILVIMQIPGASGIYPIQLMPEFFQSLYPFFPFTYGIDAMREVVSGFAGFAYFRYMGTLLLFVAAAFFLGLVLRRHVSNLTRLFTQEVAETELFTNESEVPAGRGYRLRHVLLAMADQAAYNARLSKRLLPFARSYRKVRTAIVIVGVAGSLVIGGLGVVFPAVKLTYVGLWVLWLIIVFVALISLEYIRYSLRLSTEVGEMSDAQLRRELTELEASR